MIIMQDKIMYIPVDICALIKIRKDDTTWFSKLPNEIFSLVTDWFKNDSKVCYTRHEVESYTWKIDIHSNVYIINEKFHINNIQSILYIMFEIIIRTPDHLYVIVDEYYDEEFDNGRCMKKCCKEYEDWYKKPLPKQKTLINHYPITFQKVYKNDSYNI